MESLFGFREESKVYCIRAGAWIIGEGEFKRMEGKNRNRAKLYNEGVLLNLAHDQLQVGVVDLF